MASICIVMCHCRCTGRLGGAVGMYILVHSWLDCVCRRQKVGNAPILVGAPACYAVPDAAACSTLLVQTNWHTCNSTLWHKAAANLPTLPIRECAFQVKTRQPRSSLMPCRQLHLLKTIILQLGQIMTIPTYNPNLP